jgi:hypothetical protein
VGVILVSVRLQYQVNKGSLQVEGLMAVILLLPNSHKEVLPLKA